MALYTGASIRASPITGRCNIGAADCGAAINSSNMSTANGVDLRSRITPPSDPRSSRRDNCGRVTDSRISITTGTRPDLSEMTNGTSVPLKSGTKYTKEDVIATREVEFIASFPVSGEDQDAKTEYVRRHLTDIKFISKTRPVLLIISLSGIKVADISGETTLMAHALKRIAFATCFPEHRQFSFIAREPRAAAEDQYCHAFLARSSREADELNTLVATAFRTAYAHSQSASTPSNDTAVVPPPAAVPVGVAAGATQQPPQPLTPLPVAASASPPSFHDIVRAQLEAQREEPVADRKEAFASRLSQISTPHVDRLANERRQRRHRELSAEGVLPASASDSRLQQQRGASPATDSTPPPLMPAGDASHLLPQSQRVRKSHESPELRRGNSESPPSMNGCVVAARLPQPSSSSSSSSSNLPSCTTACSNGVTSSADAALMSNLLRVLRGNGTETRPHGSPVMILKDLIDRHFSNGGELAGILPMPPIEDFECRRPQTLTAAPATVSGRPEATAVTTRNSPSSRSRPLSDVFVSNGEIFLRSKAVENGGGGVSETPLRIESQRSADSADDDSPTRAWYQPGVPRDTVLDMLALQDVGSFVVRDSTTHPGCYALSMRVPKYETTDQGIAHYLITKTSRGTVKLKGMSKEWNSLSALVTHHTVMRELLPCQLVLPRSSGAVGGGGVALNGAERYDRSNSEC